MYNANKMLYVSNKYMCLMLHLKSLKLCDSKFPPRSTVTSHHVALKVVQAPSGPLTGSGPVSGRPVDWTGTVDDLELAALELPGPHSHKSALYHSSDFPPPRMPCSLTRLSGVSHVE